MAKKKIVSKTRRASGEGSIYLRGDGRWGGSINIGIGENGERKRKTVYGKSQAEVAKKLAELSGRIKNASYEITESQTFGELMSEWLLVFKKSAVSPRTFEGIIRNYRLHIEPQIGGMKIFEIDNFVIQKLINNLIEAGYSSNTIKKNKHLLGQFFEYAIDNKWVNFNPTLKVKVRTHERLFNRVDKYKALAPDERIRFLKALNKDEANFIKPLCVTLMFAGLRIGEALALQWKNVDFNNKTIKVDKAITTVPKFDESGKIKCRVTVIGDTKTTCSVREIPATDVVLNTLQEWKNKLQSKKGNKVDLLSPNAYVFAKGNGEVRTYYGTKKIFDRFKKRNDLQDLNIHFHGLRHTFSNMLFEMNENPKVIQQLLGHRDVKTTITVYNSVDSEYIRQTTDKFNEKIKQEQILLDEKKRAEEIENLKESLITDMTQNELDNLLQELIEARKEREKQKKNEVEME